MVQTQRGGRLEKFMQDHRVGDGEPFTHTSFSGGKYFISKMKHRTFAELIYEASYIHGAELDFLECRPTDGFGKMVIDIDLKFSFDNLNETRKNIWNTRKHIIQMDEIVTLVQYYVEELTNIMPGLSETKLISLLFERTSGYQNPKKEGQWKDGCHIMFPEIVLPYHILHAIRERVVSRAIEDKWIADMMTNGETVEKVIDKAVVEKNNWFLLGCGKKGIGKYEWVNTFDCHGTQQPSSDITAETIYRLMLREAVEVMEEGKGFPKKAEKVKPSSSSASHALVVRPAVQEPAKILQPIMDEYEMDMSVGTAMMGSIQQRRQMNTPFVKDILGCLSHDRIDNYHDWFLVGAALHHTNVGYIELWKAWSSQSDKYDESVCDKLWNYTFNANTGGTKASFGTISYMAQEDNRKRYYSLVKSHRMEDTDPFFRKIQNGLNCTDQDFAELLYEICKGKFVFSEDCWFEYRGNQWAILRKSNTIPLRKYIGIDMLRYYLTYGEILFQLENQDSENMRTGNINLSPSFENELKQIRETVKKLKSASVKKRVVDEAQIYFGREKFRDDLDANPYIIGFTNGILDLKTQQFRPGTPDDMVSMTCGYPYTNQVNTELREEIIQILSKIQPDTEIRNFLLTFFASTLIGTNKSEKFINLEGTGGNGKGLWDTLHQSTLGDYAGVLNNSYLVNVSSGQESHNTMLAANSKKRYLAVNEPPNTHGKRLNINFIKELTGGDKIQLRVAHDPETKTVEPMFTLCMLFNEFPPIDNPHDGGFSRRFVGIHFPNKFVDREPRLENEYRQDPSLKERIKNSVELKQQYMLLLMDYLKKFIDAGELFVVPESVKRNSRRLLGDQDPVYEFIHSELEVTGNPDDVVRRTDVWEAFREYIRQNYQHQKIAMKVTIFSERLMNSIERDKVEYHTTKKIVVQERTVALRNVYTGMRFAERSFIPISTNQHHTSEDTDE